MDIDPNLVNLLVSYAGNVGADATRWIAGKFRGRRSPAIEKSLSALNLSVQSQLTANAVSDADAEKVARFLLDSPVLGYLFMLVDAAKAEDYHDLPSEEIAGLLRLEAQLSAPAASDAAAVLVAVLNACNQVSPRSGRRLQGPRSSALSGIQLFGAQEAKRRLLADVGSPSPADIHDYSALIRREMGRKFSRIQLQHLDNGTEQLLEDLYVEPDLKLTDESDERERTIAPGQLLKAYARVVIQGPAGSGKSTTVRRLASDVAAEDEAAMVPLVVELRKYSVQQVLAPQIFLDHIRQSLAQLVQQAPPDYWLEYVLTTGRAVVLFDGLDEVLSAGTRSEVRDAVSSFSQLFPASSILVTSRYTGYDLAPFDSDVWTHVGVMDLREDQVRAYAKKWFKLKNGGADVSGRSSSFVDESRAYASDLRANPLMLSLLCSIYYARGDIPRTLHDLYERCADMIYQQWNTMRDIEDHRAWDKDVRPVLYQVAHAVLADNQYLSFGIPEEDLISEIRRAFLDNGALDEGEASRRAREAVQLWAGRAWIITTVMTDGAGRRRYGFVHQSFLEYFAAVFEVRRVDTPAELYANLRSRLIDLNGWSVTQIAVSVIQAWKDRGGQRFLAALLEDVARDCDLDGYALLRLGISLVSVVPIPAEQLSDLAKSGIRFVSRSILLPEGDAAVYEAHEDNEARTRGAEVFDPEADEDLRPAVGEISRDSVVLPTTRTSAILDDLAKVAATNDTINSVVTGAVLGLLADPSDAVVASSLLAVAFLQSDDVWPNELDGAAIALLEDAERNWVVSWIAVQLGFADVLRVIPHVPWHALLLDQELLLVDDLELMGPAPLGRSVTNVYNDVSGYRVLEAMGAAASERIARGERLPAVSRIWIERNFIFYEPPSDWRQAREPSAWSDAFLVAFAMVGKLAAVAWKNGHAFGESLNENAPPAVIEIAAAALGWGGIDDSHLGTIAEPHRSAMREMLAGPWPFPAEGSH